MNNFWCKKFNGPVQGEGDWGYLTIYFFIGNNLTYADTYDYDVFVAFSLKSTSYIILFYLFSLAFFYKVQVFWLEEFSTNFDSNR